MNRGELIEERRRIQAAVGELQKDLDAVDRLLRRYPGPATANAVANESSIKPADSTPIGVPAAIAAVLDAIDGRAFQIDDVFKPVQTKIGQKPRLRSHISTTLWRMVKAGKLIKEGDSYRKKK